MRVLPSRSARSHKPQYLLAAIVPALIVVLSISGFVWAQKKVTVVVDGKTLEVQTQASDVAAVLREAEVIVDAADVVTPALDSVLNSGDMVVVRHAVPVTLDLSGNKVPMDVVGDTVADALVAAGADPASNPDVTPPVSEKLEPGMTINVPDVFVRVSKAESTVAAPVEYLKDPSLPKGTKKVVTKGDDGTLLRVYRVLVTNGREGAPVVAAEHLTEKPETRVVRVGTGRTSGSISAAIASADLPKSGRRMRVETTGYSAAQPDLNDITATGAKARHGVIAVDPRVIPLGTRVFVPGYGYAVAEDTGGAIKGRRIDLCFDTVEECFQWGRRTVTIVILD